jgi:hypothetical protein
LGKISDFHHLILILPSKPKKVHFNSIKISQVKIKRNKGGQFWRKLKCKVNQIVKGDKDQVDWQSNKFGLLEIWHMC